MACGQVFDPGLIHAASREGIVDAAPATLKSGQEHHVGWCRRRWYLEQGIHHLAQGIGASLKSLSDLLTKGA
jgi:hypothetical protein